jgi:hypothetical protein
MFARIFTVAGSALLALSGTAIAATKLMPNEIQATFFNGQPFTAATPSGVKFKMLFMPDGKATRAPVASAGSKGEGTWKLSQDGFCTSWQGSKPNCFVVVANGTNRWSVMMMKSSTMIAEWSK